MMIPITMANNSISTKTSTSPWCKIHNDLLDFVLTRLSFLDKLRIRGVCTSWRSITKTHISHLLKLSPSTRCPLLMLPTFSSENYIQESCARGLFRLEDNKFEKVKNISVDMGNSVCLGSSKGWLVFSDENYTRYRMLNPFVDVCITLCYLPKLPSVTKVVFWSDPVLSGCKYAIVALHKHWYGSNVAYAMCGDGNWRFLNGEKDRYSDIVCVDNLVYALSRSGTIEAWDFSNYEPSKTISINPYFLRETTGEFNGVYQIQYTSKLHLVCSRDELLMVVQYCERLSFKTKNFYVYWLDKETKKWVKRDNLGDMLLILGGNRSVMVAAKDVQGYKKNSIYFSDYKSFIRNIYDYHRWNEIGVFDLEDRSIKWIKGNLMDINKLPPPLFWIVPNFN